LELIQKTKISKKNKKKNKNSKKKNLDPRFMLPLSPSPYLYPNPLSLYPLNQFQSILLLMEKAKTLQSKK
jgi:hypothetical protein